jgi:hypothetical protein
VSIHVCHPRGEAFCFRRTRKGRHIGQTSTPLSSHHGLRGGYHWQMATIQKLCRLNCSTRTLQQPWMSSGLIM